jgi:Cof subfamily protein (haloacid dehalogenase superfamily)
MFPEIRLIAVDLDGTLLRSDGSIAPQGAEVLRKTARSGVKVVQATMRSPAYVRMVSQVLEIDDPMICANGAWVFSSPNGPAWEYRTIPKETARILARVADEHQWELLVTVGGFNYIPLRPGQTPGPLDAKTIISPSNELAIVGDPIRILTVDPQAGEMLSQICRTEHDNHCQSEIFLTQDGGFHSMAIGPKGVDKGKGLGLVLDRLGIRKEQVMAIGDNFVDLPMFMQAGVSVAMGNAPLQVKNAATFVAPSQDEEGVASAVRRVFSL